MIARRHFTKEFKQGIIKELETNSLTAVCREHSLHPSTVSTWKRDYDRDPREAFKGHGRLWKPEAKVAQYERLIGELYAENSFLKKVYEHLKAQQAQERRGRRNAP
ncbi:MAG: hypothetical protein A3K16_03555 [Omnitrophica bacterium RIFCSPLOWO2_01_FULL_45_24]|nr:MAG: hypothetical protein A3K16_03555 [Omnitrophica bacterium RIFCSPLOWO2_01_FULL_45_24]